MLHFRDRMYILNKYRNCRKEVAVQTGTEPEDNAASFVAFLIGHCEKVEDGVYLLTIKNEEKKDG